MRPGCQSVKYRSHKARCYRACHPVLDFARIADSEESTFAQARAVITCVSLLFVSCRISLFYCVFIVASATFVERVERVAIGR